MTPLIPILKDALPRPEWLLHGCVSNQFGALDVPETLGQSGSELRLSFLTWALWRSSPLTIPHAQEATP